MNPYNFSVLCFSFCSLMIGLFVWLKRNDTVGLTFLFFSMSASVWGMGYAFLIGQDTPYSVALVSTRISHAAASLIPITWFHFTSIFVGISNRYKKTLSIIYVLSAGMVLLSFTPWIVLRLAPKLNFTHYPQPGLLYNAFTFLFFFVVGIGFWHLIHKIVRSKEPEKSQFQGLLIASTLGFLGGSLTFLPVYDILIPQYGVFLMPAFPFFIAYFMIKKQLFDAEAFVKAAHRDKLAAIGTLATSINHEIRNPLYVIQGFSQSHLENLKEGRYTDEKQALEKANEIINRAIDQTQRAMDIVKRFSSFAKQGVKEASQFEQVYLSKAIEGILPLVHHELENDQIELAWNLPKDLPAITADRRQIEEIFFNLIVNACQALKPQPNGKIEIRGEKVGDHICIEIADDGPGMSPEYLKHIFEPFYTTKEEGTGLGLYITKQLVERNGGKISVESKPGQGTTFILDFK